MTARGVVTLCDEHYLPGLIRLHESVHTSHPCPIVCFDAGTAHWQEATRPIMAAATPHASALVT